jgi:hypothetical protein
MLRVVTHAASLSGDCHGAPTPTRLKETGFFLDGRSGHHAHLFKDKTKISEMLYRKK